ncbi:hypothetical protein BL15B_03370, partial [Bifidobacterium longum subsp. longum 1-5B]
EVTELEELMEIKQLIQRQNLDYPTAFMIRIRKSVQNIIRHLMKSAVGNGQKCNCVMIRLMLLP